MNMGLTPDELVDYVKLPPHLAEAPYIQRSTASLMVGTAILSNIDGLMVISHSRALSRWIGELMPVAGA